MQPLNYSKRSAPIHQKVSDSGRFDDTGQLIEVIEKEIVFVEGKGSESRSNGPPTFAKIDSFKDSRQELFPRNTKTKYNKPSYSTIDAAKTQSDDRLIADQSIASDEKENHSTDNCEENHQDTQYFISSAGLHLDLKNLKLNQSIENTSERNQLKLKRQDCHKQSGKNLILNELVKDHHEEIVREYNFSLVEELSQQIVKLNSANGQLQKQITHLHSSDLNLDKVRRLEDSISKLTRENDSLKKETVELKTELRVTMENFKRYHEEMINDIQVKHKKALDTTRMSFENELDKLKKENRELLTKIKRCGTCQKGEAARDPPMDRNPINIIKTPQGVVFSAWANRKPSKPRTPSCEEDEEPAQVIVSPKPNSRSKSRSSNNGGFYCNDDIEDYHTYLKETHGVESVSNFQQQSKLNPETLQPKHFLNQDESFSIMIKSKKKSCRDLKTDQSIDFQSKPRDTSQKILRNCKQQGEKDKSSNRATESSKQLLKPSVEKKEAALNIHKSKTRPELVNPYASIINNSKVKPKPADHPKPSKSKNRDRSLSKKSANKSAKKTNRSKNPIKSRVDLASSSAWKKDPHHNSFMTNISGGAIPGFFQNYSNHQ